MLVNTTASATFVTRQNSQTFVARFRSLLNRANHTTMDNQGCVNRNNLHVCCIDYLKLLWAIFG